MILGLMIVIHFKIVVLGIIKIKNKDRQYHIMRKIIRIQRKVLIKACIYF